MNWWFPTVNPEISFAVPTFLELAAAVTVCVLVGWFGYHRGTLAANIAGRFRASASHSRLYILAAAILPIAVRLAILPWWPAPEPKIADEFGHLLVADTLANGRLANPPHVLWQHFETIYVVHRPTYASVYPIGQGFILSVGKVLAGHPWAGVLLAVALMSGATSWMLFACLPPIWAAAGGLLFAVQYGLSLWWIDTYWGGASCAFGGAILFGALCRLRRGPSKTMAALVGIGWMTVWLIRPFESLLPLLAIWVAIVTFMARSVQRKKWLKPILIVFVLQTLAGGVTALHNHAVTGSFTTLPYMLDQKLHGVPQGLLWQKMVEEPPHLFAEQKAVYSWQKEKAEVGPASRLAGTLYAAWSFFVNCWYSLPLALSLLLLKDPRVAVGASIVVGALAVSVLYPFFFPHYFAAYACVLSFLILRGLMLLSRWSFRGRGIGLIAVAFLVTGGLAARLEVPAKLVDAHWNEAREPNFRTQLAQHFASLGGQHVIFVRYVAGHSFHNEWVYNDADIDSSPLVWCRSIGAVEDAEVAHYYKGRQLWIADVGNKSALVAPYAPELRKDSPEPFSVSLKKLPPASANLMKVAGGNSLRP